eukprot:COSAG01_NODE_2639_length_7326_cov_15.912550_8_plen_72_part_00
MQPRLGGVTVQYAAIARSCHHLFVGHRMTTDAKGRHIDSMRASFRVKDPGLRPLAATQHVAVAVAFKTASY